MYSQMTLVWQLVVGWGQGIYCQKKRQTVSIENKSPCNLKELSFFFLPALHLVLFLFCFTNTGALEMRDLVSLQSLVFFFFFLEVRFSMALAFPGNLYPQIHPRATKEDSTVPRIGIAHFHSSSFSSSLRGYSL